MQNRDVFGNTYACEQLVSKMKYTKKLQVLDDVLLLSLTNISPYMGKLSHNKQKTSILLNHLPFLCFICSKEFALVFFFVFFFFFLIVVFLLFLL